MKRMFVLAVAALMLTSCCGNGCGRQSEGQACGADAKACDRVGICNATADELAGIRKALSLYCEAAVKGDSKVAEPAFASTATISHVEDGKLISLPIKALYEYYDQTGPHDASYEIASCRVATDVAVVEINSRFGEARFVDMFTMAKDGDDWKIISKIFHVR